MIFLIEYDRHRGQLVSLLTFEDSQQRAALDHRLKLELKLNADRIAHEVVILEAASEADLRRTHRRYFLNLADLSSAPETAPSG